MLWRCREDFRFNGEVFISLKQKCPKDPCHMLLARSCLHPTQGQKASLRLSGWRAAIWHCSNVMSNVISQMWKARLMLGDLGAAPLVVFGDVSGVSGRVLCHSVESSAQLRHLIRPVLDGSAPVAVGECRASRWGALLLCWSILQESDWLECSGQFYSCWWG